LFFEGSDYRLTIAEKLGGLGLLRLGYSTPSFFYFIFTLAFLNRFSSSG
jgi:hypothetical protein